MSLRVTMLNGMADADLSASLARQAEAGIRDLDLKDQCFGGAVEALDATGARRAAALAAMHGQRVHCLSTSCFGRHVEDGEAAFRTDLATVKRICAEVVPILRPRLVRLLACRCRDRAALADPPGKIARRHPWLAGLYREAVTAIAATGVVPVIENEVDGCILAKTADFHRLAALIGHPALRFTWDVQNLWQEGGSPPDLATHAALAPLLANVHLKGGIAGADGRLRWASPLAASSYPILAILRAVAASGTSPVICLNPPHGERRPGVDLSPWTDLAWLRAAPENLIYPGETP